MSPPDAPPPEPVFAEPWQASAFAITLALNARGIFTWSEWADRLGAEVRSGDPYYDCWLRALEGLLADKGLAAASEVDATAAAWRRAAHATPHGQAIVLENDPLR